MFSHLHALIPRGVSEIVLHLVLVERIHVGVKHRRFPFRGACDDVGEEVQRFDPVGFPADRVFALYAHRDERKRGCPGHIDGRLGAFRDGFDVVADILRQGVNGKRIQLVPAKRDGFFPRRDRAVVHFWGDIIRLAGDLLMILGRAAPDGLELLAVERRDASLRLTVKELLGFRRVAVAFHGADSPMEHRVVPAAFPYLPAHIGEAVLVKEHGQIDVAGLHVDLRVRIAVEKARRVLRPVVKIRIRLLHPFDQQLVSLRIGDPVNEENDVVFWPRRFAVLRLHVVAARVKDHRHVGEPRDNILLCDPVARII